MKVLFIAGHYLDGRPSGGTFASTAYANAFAEISDSITVIYKDRGFPARHVSPKAELIPVRYDKPSAVKAFNQITGRVNKLYHEALKHVDGKYDIVVFDNSMTSFRLIRKFREAGTRTICIHHNYQYEYFRDNTGWKELIPTLFWCRMYERQAVRQCDLGLTLTDQDISLLHRHYGDGRLERIGVFEYERRAASADTGVKSRGEMPVFIISGSLVTKQTEQSILPWLNTCYPVLRKLYPHHRLILAGRSPSAALYRECRRYPEIEIVADPEDMDEVIRHADCYLCPTALGGGLKLRIMDGLRQGLCVCTHEVSARGYDRFKGRCLFSYHDEAGFAKALTDTVQCKSGRQEVISMYNEEFSFDSGVLRLKKILFGL